MSKKKQVQKENMFTEAQEVRELLQDENNYGLYSIYNNITKLSGSIIREKNDTVAYQGCLSQISKLLEDERYKNEKLSNFSVIRLGVINIETSTIINIDRYVMPLEEDLSNEL